MSIEDVLYLIGVLIVVEATHLTSLAAFNMILGIIPWIFSTALKFSRITPQCSDSCYSGVSDFRAFRVIGLAS